jgi:exopolysaccharide production protein ExoZ
MRTKTKQTLNSLQAARAFAAIAVILYHVELTLGLAKYLNKAIFPMFRSGKSGVQFFFVLSGFVIWLAHEKDLGKPRAVGMFLWKRFRRLYPTLWLVLALIIPIYFLAPSFGHPEDRSATNILAAFLITPVRENLILLTPEWTLRHEVVFYLLFAIAICNKSLGTVLLAVWFFLSGSVSLMWPSYPWSFLFNSNHLLFGFGIGACWITQSQRINFKIELTSAIAGAAMYAYMWSRFAAELNYSSYTLDLLYGVASSILIIGIVCLEKHGHLVLPRWLVFLGEASYSLYLVHYPLISTGAKAIPFMKMHLPLSDRVEFSLVVLFALIGGVAFHILAERPLLRRLGVAI